MTQPLIAPRAWHAMGTADMGRDLAQLSVSDKKRAIALAAADAIMAVVLAEGAAQLNRVGLQTALEREQLTEPGRAGVPGRARAAGSRVGAGDVHLVVRRIARSDILSPGVVQVA